MIRKPALRMAHSPPTVECACAPPAICSPARQALARWLERQAYQDTDLYTAISLQVQNGKRRRLYPDDMTVADWAAEALRGALGTELRREPVEIDAQMAGEISEHLTEMATAQTWQEFLTDAAWERLRSRQDG